MSHVLRYGALLCLATVTGAVAAFVHATTAQALGVSWPIGLVAAVLSCVAVVALARIRAETRWGVAGVFGAWLLPVALVSQETAAGDVVLAADLTGLLFVAGVTVVGTVGLGLPLRSALARAPHEGHEASRTGTG